MVLCPAHQRQNIFNYVVRAVSAHGYANNSNGCSLQNKEVGFPRSRLPSGRRGNDGGKEEKRQMRGQQHQ